MSLEPGLERSDEFTVEDWLLTDVGGTIDARVLSTPGMIAMMERCASILSYEHLPDGKATVGFEICVKHVAAAGEGARCTPARGPAALCTRACARWWTAASSASRWRSATASGRSGSARTSGGS